MDIQKKKEELIRAQKRKQFEDGQIDVWSLFKNYVILGDSRSEGFIDFKYLSSDRVLASKGDNIDSIPAHIDQIRKLNPSQIFVCYGMNDLTNNVGGSVDGWIAKYEDYINQLKQAVPGAEIFINDIMAPQEAAYAVSGNLAYFSQYNDKLRTLCRKIGVHYIDTSGTTAEHADLYAPDGIHFNYEFYPYWAAAMQYTAMGGDEEAGEEQEEERNAEDEETTDS
jgi:lysophospholipase L1-like esterase